MCRIPSATLYTLKDAIANIDNYANVIETLPRGVKDFLQTEFHKPTYSETKNAIAWRISQITVRETLDELFSAERNAIDFAEAINQGKIILISTELNFLKDLSPILGKYFITRILSAAQERAALHEGERRQVHLYIDEAAAYLDQKIEEVLTTLRSYGVGAILAFQDTHQMGAYLHTIRTNTAIKLMANASPDDAKAFASSMHCEPQFIVAQKKEQGQWPTYTDIALYHTDLPHAIPISLRFGLIDQEPQLDSKALALLRERNRARVRGAPRATPKPAPKEEGVDTKPSDKW